MVMIFLHAPYFNRHICIILKIFILIIENYLDWKITFSLRKIFFSIWVWILGSMALLPLYNWAMMKNSNES